MVKKTPGKKIRKRYVSRFVAAARSVVSYFTVYGNEITDARTVAAQMKLSIRILEEEYIKFMNDNEL